MILGDNRFELRSSNIFARIANVKFWTAVTLVKDGCTSPSCFQGWEAEMLFLLQEKLNFTFRVVHERIPGFERKNGSWTGIIGESRK